MVCTESGCTIGLKVSHWDKSMFGKGRTDLYVEPEQSPVFGGDDIGLVWRAYSQTRPSTKYTRDG